MSQINDLRSRLADATISSDISTGKVNKDVITTETLDESNAAILRTSSSSNYCVRQCAADPRQELVCVKFYPFL